MKSEVNLIEKPAPQIKTEIVSEISFTKDQLVELVRAHYGAEVVPRVKVEAEAIYGCGKLCHVKFTWSKPREQAVEQGNVTTIMVNGRKKVVTTAELSFTTVVRMAFDNPPSPHNWPLLTVTYSSDAGNGVLTEGDRVKVLPGMIFDVADTSNA